MLGKCGNIRSRLEMVDCLFESVVVVVVGDGPGNFNLLGNGGGGMVGSNCGI